MSVLEQRTKRQWLSGAQMEILKTMAIHMFVDAHAAENKDEKKNHLMWEIGERFVEMQFGCSTREVSLLFLLLLLL
jgi:hypothetical protein